MYTGPKLTNDDLVFGYDTGYGIADNDTATRFYPGGPTVNYVTDASLLQNGWGGSYSLIDSATKSFQFNVSSFNGSAGSGQGWRSFMWDMRSHAGSAVTISATIEVPSDSPGNFAWVMMGQANSRADGTTTATYLGYSASSERVQKTTKTKERITWSGTIGNTGTANQPNGIIGFTVWYNGGTNGTNHFIKVSNVQIEKVAHETPFVNGTRSSTASLIDLKRTTNIDVGNVSFDSTGQPTFDGSDDRGVVENFPHIWNNSVSMECVIKFEDSNRSIIFGNYNVNSNDVNFEKLTNGNLRFYWNRGERDIVSSNNVVTQNGSKYHYCVFVRDTVNNNFKFYVDGALVNTVSNAGTNLYEDNMPTNHNKFRIGADTRTGSTVHNGEIPIIKVYDKALSAAEVTQNYNAYKNRFDI